MAQPQRRNTNRRNQQQRPPPPKKSSGGGFALFFVALIACAGAAFVLFPDRVMQLLGRSPAPVEEQEVVDTKPETTTTPVRTTPTPVTVTEAEPTATPIEVEHVEPIAAAVAPVQKTYADEQHATSQLALANAAYQSFEWTKSRNIAAKILNMDAPDTLTSQAKQLISTSKNLQKFMKSMSSKQDGMVRGIYIHPALTALHMQNGGDPVLVIPIKSLNDSTPIQTADGAAYITEQLNATGKAFCMTEKGIAAAYTIKRVLEAKSPDTPAINGINLATFKSKHARVESNELLKNDAIALYEVARYGYFVGADTHVTDLLERALLLEPALAETVRNDRARGIFDKLVRVMKKNPKGRSAAGFVAQLKKHYQDTPVYSEARAYYKGEYAHVAQLQKQENTRKKEERAKARAITKKKAQAEGNQDTLKKLAKIEKQEAEEEQVFAAVTGDEAEADAIWAEGAEYLRTAILEAADDGSKDKLLKKAFVTISKAYNIYSKLAEDGSDSAMRKLPECGQDKYLAKKTMRPIW